MHFKRGSLTFLTAFLVYLDRCVVYLVCFALVATLRLAGSLRPFVRKGNILRTVFGSTRDGFFGT